MTAAALRIALHADGRSIRGNERQLALVVEGLIARGHAVHASCVGGGVVQRELEKLGARTTGVRPRGDLDPIAFLRFTAWLRRLRPDAVLLTSWKRAAIGAAAARLAGVPRIVQRIGGTHAVPPGPRRLALRRWAHVVWVNSEDLRSHYLREVPDLDAGRVVVVRNAVPPGNPPPALIRAELALEPDARLVLGVGGLEPRKRFDVLLDAVAALPAQVHLAIAGEGRLRDALSARAARPDLAGRVHLLDRRNDVPALMRAADAFALASRSESMPVVVLEAMAAGVPIVATIVAGTREQLAPRADAPAAGWLVPVGDAAALAHALTEALDGDGEAQRRAAEARRRAGEEFTPERLVAGVEALLRGRE